MPQISYDELKKTISVVEKQFKTMPADPERDEMFRNIKEFSEAIHPLNSRTSTAKLTTQEQRRELYGDMQQYLNIFADQTKIGGSTASDTATVKGLDELNITASTKSSFRAFGIFRKRER